MAENIISPIDIYYKASKNENFNVQTNVPIELQENLMNKKIAVKNFYLENTAVPMFIPAWLNGENVRQISYDVGNYSSINSTKNINSLGYTVSLTTKDDNFGVDCFIIHQSNDYNSPTPLDYPSSEEYFDTNKYYWYKTFERFLKNLASQIVTGINQLNTNASITPSDAVIFEFAVTSDNYIQLTVNEETLNNMNIQLSLSLLSFLPFELDSDGYLEFTTLNKTSVDGVGCINSFAQFYSSVFPFNQLVFTSETIPLEPTQFISGSDYNYSSQATLFRQVILKYNIANNTPTLFKNFWRYENDNPTINYYSFNQQNPAHNILSLGLFLRTRSNVLIPYPMDNGNVFLMDLDVLKIIMIYNIDDEKTNLNRR